ncbi:hypothetical protein IFM89_034897, partial [Coptis chinensis]
MDEFTSVLSEMQEHVGSLKSLWSMDALDEAVVKYDAQLEDGTVVSKFEGWSLPLVMDLHDVLPLQPCYFCPALSKSCKDNEEAREDGFVEMGRPASSAEGVVPPCATLVITLELVLWKTVIEVIDKKVIKKIIKEGEVKRIGKLQDGTVFLKKGRDDDELFQFKTDERNSLHLAEQVIDGLDRAVMTMKKGEERESWDMNTPEKIEAAGKKKEEGNVAFVAGKYAKASQRYEKAGKFIEYNTNFSEEENKKSKVLKLADLDLAEIDIKKALEIDPNYRCEICAMMKPVRWMILILEEVRMTEVLPQNSNYSKLSTVVGGTNSPDFCQIWRYCVIFNHLPLVLSVDGLALAKAPKMVV